MKVYGGIKTGMKMFTPMMAVVLLAPQSSGLWAAGKTGATKADAVKAGTAKANAAQAGAGKVGADYVLEPDDVIEITVRNHSDLNQQGESAITVRPDGKIAFPYAGEIKAAGKTARALAAEIQAKLAKTLNHAYVMVSVKAAQPRYARVVGAVKTAGAYPLKPNWRLMDLVTLAGGLSAKPVRVSGRVVRAGGVIPINVEQAVLRPESNANLPLKPNDLVILDEQDITKQVSVMGVVGKPGAYDLEEGLTVVSLVAEAGGAMEGAALRKAYVMRGSAQIPLNLEPVLVDGATDEVVTKFKFRPGDILVVPENQARFGVMGQVTKPAYYPLPEKQEQATVLKALALAGGQLPEGDLRHATITRTVEGKAMVFPLNIESMLKGNAPDNVLIQADDVLHVPKIDNQVHVLGQVGKPGAYDLKDGMTLMSLISEAGSPTTGASFSKAYVLREESQIPINLHTVFFGGVPDKSITNFKLQRGDVLIIPDVSNQVHVMGQVAKAGSYNLDDNLTVVSLVAQAGSTTEGAALSKAYVQREGNRIPLDLHALLVEGKTDADADITNFKFQPGDVLIVPENQVRYAVMGQVAKPGYYPFPEKKGEATVLKALGAAGGQTPGKEGGDLSNAGIIRVVGGKATLIKVNIEDVLKKGKVAGNIELRPEDVLYIPPRRQGFKWPDVLQALPFVGYLGIGR